MSKPEMFSLMVTYTDGTRERFKFPPQADKFAVAGLLEKLMRSAVVSLQLKGRLLVIPTANIRSVELYPVPDTLPDVVLQGVQREALDD